MQQGSLHSSESRMTRLARYSVELFADLARQGAKTGYDNRFHDGGTARRASGGTQAPSYDGNAFGVQCDLIGLEHVHQHWLALKPAMSVEGIAARGRSNQFQDTTLALAKGAPRWSHIFEDTKVDRQPLSTAL